MVEATILALVAAGLHAGWNIAIKVRGDRLAFLGAQFVLGGVMGVALLAILGDLGSVAWPWACTSAAIHIPYLLLLALAYRQGDFSLVYPLARGGGALLAAVGGVVLLDDHLTPQTWLAIAVVAGGLVSLAAPSVRSAAVTSALLLAAVIAAYTLADARGARSSASPAYGLATFAAGAIGASLVLLVTRRGALALRLVRTEPRACLGVAAASVAAYALVLAVVRVAPVGYVTCLRESSVVLAALAGWKLLHEPLGPRRVVSSIVVLGGLVLLIVAA